MVTVLYLITFILFAGVAVQRIIRDKNISLYPFFVISISVLYLFIPAVVFCLGEYDKLSYDLIKIIYNSSYEERMVIYFLVVICFALVTLMQKVRIGKPAPQYLNLESDYKKSQIKSVTYGICIKWFWALWVIGMACTCVIIAKIGIKGLIIFSGSSRGEGDIQLLSGSLFAYAVNFSRLLIASLVPGILAYELKKSAKMKIFLIITFALSVLLQIFNAGKTNFIIFIVPFVIYWFLRNGGIKVKYIVILAGLVVALVPFLDSIFYYISSGESIGQYRESWNILNHVMSIVKQFTYPYANMVMRHEITNYYGYRYFIDYLATIVNIFPASLLGGFQLDTLYHLTTNYYQSVLMHKGGMPNDFLFFCYRQFGVAGIMLLSVITGIIIKRLDEILYETKELLQVVGVNSGHFFTSVCFACVVFVLIEPFSVIMSFPSIILSIIIMIHVKYRLRLALKKDEENI